MCHIGQLPNRARRAPGLGEAVISRMPFSQVALHGVPRRGIESRPFQTEVRRSNHWATTTPLVVNEYRAKVSAHALLRK